MIYYANKKSKYGNKKIKLSGGTFDSRLEAARWGELKLLQKAKKISDLERQKKYLLIPAQYEDGKCVERACSYVADFVYKKDGETIVEDTKGFKTPEYKIKKKLMLYVHGIRIREVIA